MAGSAISFEKALTRLEQINEELSSGEISLDEGIKLFEEGLRLSAYCRGKLDEAKSRLLQAEGSLNNERDELK